MSLDVPTRVRKAHLIASTRFWPEYKGGPRIESGRWELIRNAIAAKIDECQEKVDSGKGTESDALMLQVKRIRVYSDVHHRGRSKSHPRHKYTAETSERDMGGYESKILLLICYEEKHEPRGWFIEILPLK